MPRRIFCEERIVIAFVIPRKPLSKKKIQYQHEYHEYNIGGCEYSQIFPSQIPVFFAIYLKLIRLAMDAIRVPRPPILVPTIKAR